MFKAKRSCKWVLMGKGDAVKIIPTNPDFVVMTFAAIFPVILLVDTIFNGLWKYSLGAMLPPILAAAMVSISNGESGLPLILSIILSAAVSILYYSNKYELIHRRLGEIGWSEKGVSNQKKRSNAIDEWISNKTLITK